MLYQIIRLCLLFTFLLCSGCFGGPKVVPPEVTGEGAAGIAGTDRTARIEDTAGGDMDAGISTSPKDPTSGGAGGRGEDFDAYPRPDAELVDEDDSGSTHEP